jgi:hypothetical protein
MNKKIKGRPITCKICGHQWKFLNKQEREDWQKQKLPCLKCGEIYCTLPKSERELRKIQTQYLITRSNKDLSKMYLILRDYAESIIKKRFVNTPYFQTNLLKDYAHDSATYVLEQFQINKDFKINISFGKYLFFKIRQVLFGKQNYTVGDESLDYQYDDGNYIEYEDNNYMLLEEIEDKDNKRSLCNYLTDIIFNIEHWCSCKKENYIRLLNVHNYLYHGEKLPEKFYSLYKREQNQKGFDQYLGSFLFMKTIDILRLELLELHKLNNTVADSSERG